MVLFLHLLLLLLLLAILRLRRSLVGVFIAARLVKVGSAL